MANPRFQCLKTASQITKMGLNLRAAFSTSQTSRSDEPPKRMTTADMLEFFPPGTSSEAPKPLQNPIRQSTLNAEKGEANAHLMRLYKKNQEKRKRELMESQRMRSSNSTEEFINHNLAADLSKQITRRWKAGDIYAPHDLSEVEMQKWKRRGRPQYDVFDVLDFNPLEHYRNFAIMSEYITPMGRIFHSRDTGLRPVNQRRIAKAIRRLIGMGMMPSVHRHPELLYKMAQKYKQNTAFKVDGPV
ncbi:hypothetical protein PZA11_003946 [Diplocarpon coronariae]|uniref:Small ribosomal subunit protein bS18m n=1 Tax=Diplocarpon coronariae TaxID=2795749 RepID=A0A218ZAQ7_9HELO|nr:hypothetical protein B2J93_8301 [Marssonina coronariae]